MMPLKFYYIRLVRYYKRTGLRQVIKRIIEKLYLALFKRDNIVFYYDLTLFDEHKMQNPPNVTIESKTSETQIGKEDLYSLFEHIGEEIILKQLKDRFLKAAVLWMIKVDGKLAGYVWSIGSSKLLGPYYFPLCEKDVFLFDGSVLPQYRGKNIYPLLLANVLHGVKQTCFIRAICDATEWNISVQKSFSKVGMKRLGIVKKFRFLGRNFLLWKKE
jgi:hypothetical protein